ncbi:MAG: hypothetical protein KDA80_08050, partial [Planctomycetaceae bacterium]|nr:hypothetical protein [Planctomycetaceae bacterium]
MKIGALKSFLFCLTAATSMITPAIGVAQPADPPKLVLDINGPNGRTFGVGFSRDSRRLYAAGASKVVHVWDVGWNLPENPDHPPVATPIRTLRWELSRAERGRINAMALSPAHDRLAIGGNSARDYGITLFNLQTNEVETTLPLQFSPQNRNGPDEYVRHLDFSPDGNSLVSVAMNGEIWVWNAPQIPGGNWSGRIIRGQDPSLNSQVPAIFVDNNHIVAA